jgi:uncharacterized protein YyaL (SSP411 family)
MRMANRLEKEKSPYLLQHKENPVDWYPWGEEAFQRAKQEDKPVFLSIGYSTCHWCHVMAHESFEDEEVAEILNRSFVCVKVDREERPDVDAVYMSVCQAVTGSGGWPLTVFLTPEQKPFFCGDLLPKVWAVWTAGTDRTFEAGCSSVEAATASLAGSRQRDHPDDQPKWGCQWKGTESGDYRYCLPPIAKAV